MLKEFLRHYKEDDFRDQGVSLHKTRETLVNFLIVRGEVKKESLLHKFFAGGKDVTSKPIDIEIKKKKYSLVISTPSSLQGWNQPASINIDLYRQGYVSGAHIHGVEIPSETEYSIMDLDDRIKVNRNLKLINQDVIPLIDKELQSPI